MPYRLSDADLSALRAAPGAPEERHEILPCCPDCGETWDTCQCADACEVCGEHPDDCDCAAGPMYDDATPDED